MTQMTVGADTLTFTYDASGSPQTVTYGGTTYYYATNLQGDVIAILNSTGTKVVSYTYDAWGNILNSDEVATTTLGTLNPLRYRGYVYDHETGLYYLQSRYYNPKLGRFINADALVSTGQGLLGNNMFAYCGNNPVTRSDPTGEIWKVGIIIAVCLLVAAGCTEDAGPYSHQANCYAYAMQLEYDPRTGEPFSERPDPGAFSGDPLGPQHVQGPAQMTIYNIQNRFIADAEALGYTCYMVYSADYPVREGGWVIAVAITSPVSHRGWDYHFWRRDEDGTWSHKPGTGPIQYTDFSGNTIYDPRNCDRGKYGYWIGYFVMIPIKR